MNIIRYIVLWMIGLCLCPVAWADGSLYASRSVLSEGRWVKLRIDETGIYRLSYDDLRSMGFSDPVSPCMDMAGGLWARTLASLTSTICPLRRSGAATIISCFMAGDRFAGIIMCRPERLSIRTIHIPYMVIIS